MIRQTVIHKGDTIHPSPISTTRNNTTTQKHIYKQNVTNRNFVKRLLNLRARPHLLYKAKYQIKNTNQRVTFISCAIHRVTHIGKPLYVLVKQYGENHVRSPTIVDEPFMVLNCKCAPSCIHSSGTYGKWVIVDEEKLLEDNDDYRIVFDWWQNHSWAPRVLHTL